MTVTIGKVKIKDVANLTDDQIQDYYRKYRTLWLDDLAYQKIMRKLPPEKFLTDLTAARDEAVRLEKNRKARKESQPFISETNKQSFINWVQCAANLGTYLWGKAWKANWHPKGQELAFKVITPVAKFITSKIPSEVDDYIVEGITKLSKMGANALYKAGSFMVDKANNAEFKPGGRRDREDLIAERRKYYNEARNQGQIANEEGFKAWQEENKLQEESNKGEEVP